MKEKFNKQNKFGEECKVIDLRAEYGKDFVGQERYGLITSLTKAELKEKYPEQTAVFEPYVLLPEEFAEIRAGYIRNEDKFRKRAVRSYGVSLNSDFIDCYSELQTPDTADEYEKTEIQNIVRNAVDNLNALQRKRIQDCFFMGKSFYTVASEENKHVSSVRDCCYGAMAKMRKEIIKSHI